MNAFEQAKANIKRQLGLSNDPKEWSLAERIAYNKALAVYIQNNQGGFTTDQVNRAVDINTQNSDGLEDTSFLSDLSAFGSAFTDNVIGAGNQVAGVGQGFLTGISWFKYIIPLLVVVGVGLLIWVGYRKAKSA